MKTAYFLLVLCLMGLKLQALNAKDSIFVYKNAFGVQFYQLEGRLTKTEAIKKLSAYHEARNEYYAGSNKLFMSSLLGGVSGGILGWQLVKYVDYGYANAAPLVIASGALLGAVLLKVKGLHQVADAVYIYNSGGKRPKRDYGMQWKLQSNQYGIGVALTF